MASRQSAQLSGDWTLANWRHVRQQRQQHENTAVLDASAIETMDTAGAWQLLAMQQKSGADITGLDEQRRSLLQTVADAQQEQEQPPLQEDLSPLSRLGRLTLQARSTLLEFIGFLGEVLCGLARWAVNPGVIPVASVVRHIRETGINALPVVSLIAFLISIVLAYQGASQLRQFGAEIFTIDMVAVSVLREMGVLLTAIIVAGRSGSAFAAEIGVMKVNEEVDALQVMGMRPMDRLILPRILGLLISLPLLTFTADIMGLLGGYVICSGLLDTGWEQYVNRLRGAVDLSDFWVGIVKAPVFALLIALVGCMRGMQVSGSAESVGRLTTTAVVHAIFLVLLADALFSILFTELGI